MDVEKKRKKSKCQLKGRLLHTRITQFKWKPKKPRNISDAVEQYLNEQLLIFEANESNRMINSYIDQI